MNSCRKMINRYSIIKSRRRYRQDSHWTGDYPSPEPSIIVKAAGRIGNWVFNRADSFFNGTSVQPSFEYDTSNTTSINPGIAYCHVWELNQDITDIAFKDIKAGLRYLFPACIRQLLTKVYQNVCIYFQADYTVQEEYSDLNKKCLIFTRKLTEDRTKMLEILQFKIEVKNVKLLLFNDWINDSIHRLSTFLQIKKIKKPYYLQGNFSPVKYEYNLDNQNCMIRGPDRANLNPAISFHIRN